MFSHIKLAILSLCLLMGISSTALPAVKSNQELLLPIVSVYDGDTIKSKIVLPVPLDKLSVRILGIDTPEKGGRAKCEYEKQLSVQARNRVLEIIGNTKVMVVTDFKYGKYAGRIVGKVTINGIDVAADLLSRGLAKPYDGGKKPKWCN